MLKVFVVFFVASLAMPVAGQQSIDINESTVTADFDLRECRKLARNLDESLECTARHMIYQKKFYSDGTPRSEDPNRGNRKWKEYLDQRRSLFVCKNDGKIVVSEEVIFVQQNSYTSEYVLTSEDGELRYTPRPGDICRVTTVG